MYILTLTNKQTNEVYTYDNVIDINTGEKLYYRFQIDTLGLVDGEYDLELTKDGILVGVNTLYVGDYETYSLQYKRGDNTFIDITLNAKLEDATAEINVEKFTLLPSEGYDGFSKVEIDATPLYDVAFGDGYTSGSTDGISQGIEIQKELLESIVINENGTYTREDGYNQVVVDVPDLNGSYDEGYQAGIEYASENAGEIAAENAIVLDATEFRTYYTKYSDNIVNPNPVTGIYPDGEKFYDYATLTNQAYNTNIVVTQDSVVELWYKGDNEITNDGWNTIFGCNVSDDTNFYLGYKYSDTNNLRSFLGGNTIEFSWIDNVWHHIIMKNDGLWIDDVLIGSFNTTNTFSYTLGINGTWSSFIRNANGCFGMIKIDDVVIIPTEDGLKNITTDEMLEVVYNEGTYNYINNDPIILDNLIKQVNVVPKINVVENGIKLAHSTFTEIPDFYDFEGITDMSYMFSTCSNLLTIPETINTSNVTTMHFCFKSCYNLTAIPETFNTSNVTNMESCFEECYNLTTIPEIDTSNVSYLRNLFYECRNLISIPPLIANKLSNDNWSGLFFFTTMDNLTDFGGLIDLKISLDNDYTFYRCPNLTYQSCINVLNGLYDFTGNGETPTSEQGQLKVHQNFLDLVADEISIGVNKGWTITA